MEETLNLINVQKGDVTVLLLKGKLDSVLSPAVEKKAIELINAGQVKLLLDLKEVSYINSAGLRSLLSIKKQLKAVKGKLMVCGLRTEVLEIMKICGFDHVLEFAKDQEEALSQF